MRNSFLLIAIVCGFASITPFIPAAIITEQTNDPPRVTVKELLEKKTQWNQKKVDVTGFYVRLFEASILYHDEADFRKSGVPKSIWVDDRPSSPERPRNYQWVEKGWLRIIGTFNSGSGLGYGHMGSWLGQITNLERVEPAPNPNEKRK